MNTGSYFCRFLTLILCVALIAATFESSFSSPQSHIKPEINDRLRVTVAFAGYQTLDVRNTTQDQLNNRLESLIRSRSDFNYVDRFETARLVPSELLNGFYENLSASLCVQLLDLTDSDYFIAAKLVNRGAEGDIEVLEGAVYRCDRSANDPVRMSSRFLMDNYDRELARIEAQFIDTIDKPGRSFISRHLTGILIVAATAIAASVILFSSSSGGGGGNGPGSPTP